MNSPFFLHWHQAATTQNDIILYMQIYSQQKNCVCFFFLRVFLCLLVSQKKKKLERNSFIFFIFLSLTHFLFVARINWIQYIFCSATRLLTLTNENKNNKIRSYFIFILFFFIKLKHSAIFLFYSLILFFILCFYCKHA